MGCSGGMLGRSRQGVQEPWGTCPDDSLNGPLVSGLFGALSWGETTASSIEFMVVSQRHKPCYFPQSGLPTMRNRREPCGSGWFSQTVHLGRKSGEILKPRGLRRALEPELSRNQQGSRGNPSPGSATLSVRGLVGSCWHGGRLPSILLCLDSWLLLTAPSRQVLPSDTRFKSSVPG